MLGAFIVIVMVGSMFGVIFYGFNSNQETFTHNKIKFTRANEWWTANLNNKKTYFNFLPPELENIKLSKEAANKLKNTMEVDITSDSNGNLTQEIALAQYYFANELSNTNSHVRVGFTGNNSFNAPVLTCNDATDFVPVIYFKESNLTQFTLNNNCLTVEIKSGIDALKIKDKLLYAIFDILE